MTNPTTSEPPVDGEGIRKVVRETNYVTWRRQGDWNPLVVTRAVGSTFWDDKGRAYLDLSSQLMATNLGHSNPAVVAAIVAQAQQLAYAGPSFATEARARLSSALLEVLPHGLDKFFFSTSGTEANEAALKIARVATGRTKVLSRYRSYHGSTAASISVTGDPAGARSKDSRRSRERCSRRTATVTVVRSASRTPAATWPVRNTWTTSSNGRGTSRP